MKHLTWLLKWILRAAIFFVLLAFALNNQQVATVRFYPGQEWTASTVLIILLSFSIGLVAGVLAMLPRWLQQRRAARQARRQNAADSQLSLSTLQPPHDA